MSAVEDSAGSLPASLSDLSVSQLVSWGAAAAMIFGGVVPYIPQYRTIKQTQNAEGFSLYVCLALLVANILRILFWFGHTFETPLLLQSIIMTVAMFMMIHLCVKVRNETQIVRGKDNYFTAPGTSQDVTSYSLVHAHRVQPRAFSDFDPNYFWQWTDFQSYAECTLSFAVVGCVAMYFFLDVPAFVHSVGFLAVFVEAMLGTPQLLRNNRNKSTQGMSTNMVVMWTMGDTFKTCYFVVREAPLQFWLCGTLQIIIDICILLQVFLYRNNVTQYKKSDS